MTEPRINATLVPSSETISDIPQRVLFVGQKTASGTAISGDLYENIQNNNDYLGLFGSSSILAEMIRAFKSYNQKTQLDVIPLSDGAGAAASGNVTFTGTATESGTLVVNIGSRKNYSYSIPVTSGDTATVIGAALETLINAVAETVPAGSSNLAGVVTITADNGGTVGNSIGLEVKGTVAGIGLSVTAMTGGTVDPSMTGVFDVIGDQRYQTISLPFEYGVSTLTDLLDPRFNVENNVLDGVGVVSVTDTFSNLVALATPLNSQSLCIQGNRKVVKTLYKGSEKFELDYNISAQFCAIRSLRLTEGADISRFVTSTQANDQFGGVSLSSLPYHNTPFPDISIVDTGESWTLDEEEDLNTAGIFILANNSAKNSIVANRVLTTYKTDNAGNLDNTWKFLNLVDTSSAVREEYFNFTKRLYAQSRLTLGDVLVNTSMINEKSIAADFTGLYTTLSGTDFVLTAAGEDSLNFYKNNLVVQITNLQLGVVFASMKVIIVTQARTFNIPIQISFSTTS